MFFCFYHYIMCVFVSFVFLYLFLMLFTDHLFIQYLTFTIVVNKSVCGPWRVDVEQCHPKIWKINYNAIKGVINYCFFGIYHYMCFVYLWFIFLFLMLFTDYLFVKCLTFAKSFVILVTDAYQKIITIKNINSGMIAASAATILPFALYVFVAL